MIDFWTPRGQTEIECSYLHVEYSESSNLGWDFEQKGGGLKLMYIWSQTDVQACQSISNIWKAWSWVEILNRKQVAWSWYIFSGAKDRGHSVASLYFWSPAGRETDIYLCPSLLNIWKLQTWVEIFEQKRVAPELIYKLKSREQRTCVFDFVTFKSARRQRAKHLCVDSTFGYILRSRRKRTSPISPTFWRPEGREIDMNHIYPFFCIFENIADGVEVFEQKRRRQLSELIYMLRSREEGTFNLSSKYLNCSNPIWNI